MDGPQTSTHSQPPLVARLQPHPAPTQIPRLCFPQSSGSGGCPPSLHTHPVGSWHVQFSAKLWKLGVLCLSGRSWSQAPSEGRKNHPWGNKVHSESLCRLLNCTTGFLLLLCLPPSPIRAPAPQEVRPPCISGHRGRERLSVSGMGGDPPPHTHTHKLENQTKSKQ